MKRIYLIMLLCVAMIGSITISSCSKDFLEKPKGGAVTTDTIFHTVRQANYAIAQMYNLCIKGYFPGNDPGNSRPETITDQVYIIHPAYSWAAATINTGTYVTGNMSANGTIDPSFSAHYRGIRQANLVYQNVAMVSDGDEAWKQDVRGQALFCRAMQHYELFRYYGGVPIVSIPLDGTANLRIPRSSVAAVVDSIVSWCDQAANLLPPQRPSTDYGKITRLAALALKSRVLLYAASPKYNTPADMKGIVSAARFNDARDSVLCYPTYDKERWNRAALAAKDVLTNAGQAGVSLYNTGKPLTTGGDNYAMLGDYESVYNVYANQELILVNTETQAPATAGAFEWDRYMSSKLRLNSWGVKNNVPIDFMQLYEKRDGSKFTFAPSGEDLPVYVQSLDLDPRFYQTIAYDGMYYNSQRGQLAYYKAGDGFTAGSLSSSDAGPDGYAFEVYKFVARINNFDDAHFAWPVFRLAEFYLNYAEAINEYSGANGEADQYLNLIRSRAGMPEKHPGGGAAFREAIQLERTIELAYEGHRYNDLNRWLTAHTVLNKQFRGIATTAKRVNNQLKRSWEIVPFINRIYPIRYYYVPFPLNEISKNYLGDGKTWDGQNPGW